MLCRLMSCRPWSAHCSPMCDCVGVWDCDVQSQWFPFGPGKENGFIWTFVVLQCWHLSSLDGSPDDVIHTAVTLLSGSARQGRSMQSTCIYWLSKYTHVWLTSLTTKSVSHCYPDGSVRLLLLAVHGASHQSGEMLQESGCVHITNGSCKKLCSVVRSNQVHPRPCVFAELLPPVRLNWTG